MRPNGSRLSCGRHARGRKELEPQTRRLAGEATQLFLTCERPPASSACEAAPCLTNGFRPLTIARERSKGYQRPAPERTANLPHLDEAAGLRLPEVPSATLHHTTDRLRRCSCRSRWSRRRPAVRDRRHSPCGGWP